MKKYIARLTESIVHRVEVNASSEAEAKQLIEKHMWNDDAPDEAELYHNDEDNSTDFDNMLISEGK